MKKYSVPNEVADSTPPNSKHNIAFERENVKIIIDIYNNYAVSSYQYNRWQLIWFESITYLERSLII